MEGRGLPICLAHLGPGRVGRAHVGTALAGDDLAVSGDHQQRARVH